MGARPSTRPSWFTSWSMASHGPCASVETEIGRTLTSGIVEMVEDVR
ncbi:hypothetical protein [Acidithiobacillus ferrivorans]|nr:hypothetical protein [Acidithiobacillus ferrivorans]